MVQKLQKVCIMNDAAGYKKAQKKEKWEDILN
jgi:hypothetical protein